MSLLNRPADAPSLYDPEGYLANGWRAADDLADALTGPPPDEDDEDERHPRPASSAGGPSDMSLDSSTGPIDLPPSYSGVSTPSGQGSLDSESGILTRAEAKELKEVVEAAENEDATEAASEDPFGDPEGEGSDADLAEATEAIDLDGDLRAREPSAAKEEEQEDEKEVQPPVPSKQTPTPRSPSPALRSLPPGPMLKRRFIENRVIETILVRRAERCPVGRRR